MRTLILAAASLAALALIAPGVVAHPTATVVEGPNGARCYIYTNDTEPPELWIESNGVTTGGVEGGIPVVTHLIGGGGEGSGLQRGPGGDTMLSPEEWALQCTA